MIELDLTHRFPLGSAIHLKVHTPGERLGLVGPSGVGKTTALRCIAGLLTPNRGRVVIGQTPLLDTVAGVSVPIADRRVAYVPQDALLFPHLTVRQNLLYSTRSDPSALDDIAARLELTALLDRHPRHLSGGERQRVALGRAILSDPIILLCDEPFSALDEARRDRLAAVLDAALSASNLHMVLVSHRVSEARTLVDNIHTMAVPPTALP